MESESTIRESNVFKLQNWPDKIKPIFLIFSYTYSFEIYTRLGIFETSPFIFEAYSRFWPILK